MQYTWHYMHPIRMYFSKSRVGVLCKHFYKMCSYNTLYQRGMKAEPWSTFSLSSLSSPIHNPHSNPIHFPINCLSHFSFTFKSIHRKMNAWAQNLKSASHVQVIYLVSLCQLSLGKVLLCNSRLVECEKRSPITYIDVCQHTHTLKGHFNLMK